MSKRLGSLRAAFGIAGLVGFVYLGLSGYWMSSYRAENANKRAYVADANDQDTRDEVIRQCGVAPTDKCAYEIQNAEESSQHEQADLRAQQETAEWTFASFLVSLGALFLSAGGLWALVWTFREQRSLTHSEGRAYLRVTGVRRSKTHPHTGWLAIDIRNDGRTPAQDVWVRYKTSVEVGRTGTELMLDAQFTSWSPISGFVVPATDSVTENDQWSARRQTLTTYNEKRAEWISDTDNSGIPAVWIVGEITYDDVFGKSYVSEFVFMTYDFGRETENWFEMWGLSKRLYVPVLVRPDYKQRRSQKKLEGKKRGED